ncbi:hypothetical protein PR202_ga09489 [Eleusine coracana subsp. coracana]|uniref:ARM repeat superfamily protein n=1 Tax=Eleusine coracana subsp. coracana TaxID=191504 RepID=A0AAV5C5B8_ELECO|nr:hypothetical protein PR202_ga09489 [Eleusine coracana subsp. coracana]
MKLRSLSGPTEIAQNEDILRMFLMACSVKTVKLSVIGLSCLQKLISHGAVASSALKEILATLKDHAEMTDEIVQLKTLQTMLILFQSDLHPESEESMSQALGICLYLLESSRSSDSVRNTAAATFRQAVALVFDNVIRAESLPSGKASSSSLSSRISSVADNLTLHGRSLSSKSEEPILRENLSDVGKLGLRLLEDLTALAAGGSVCAHASWLRVHSLHRTFALDILEFALSTYVAIFQTLLSYQQVLRHQICSLLMTSLRTNVELEGEAGEPSFRRLVLRLVSHVIRLYSSSLVTESEVFLNMLVKVTRLDLPLWHQILVLEILRGFCVEARTLRLLFQTFDMNPANTNVVENMVKALALVVATFQASDSSEETLAAVAGMFSSKAKGIEWSMDNDASNSAVLVASEAHTITLALEGLLGVVFTVATLTDEALDAGELESPKCETNVIVMTNATDRSQGEAIILEILKGYQAFTQALRTLFNVAHRLHNVLGPSWVLVLETLSALDRAIHSPHASTQEVSASVSRLSRDTSGQYSDFHILSSLNSQVRRDNGISFGSCTPVFSHHLMSNYICHMLNYILFLLLKLFESSALMNIAAVKSLLSALHQLSSQHISGNSQLSGQQIGCISFSVERMTSILVNNLHRVEPIWDQIAAHHLESIRVIMNEGLATIPVQCLDECILVTGAYGTQKTDINISLTAVGLLWTATDFVVKGLISKSVEHANHTNEEAQSAATINEANIKQSPPKQAVDYSKLFFSVFSVLQKLGVDDRPEASTSSSDEWHGKELGTRAGKAVHMLIHHRFLFFRKLLAKTLAIYCWVLLLDFVKNGVLNGSKEVALAAINCLQTFVGSNCPKGNLESSHVKSVLDIYELVLQTSPNYKNDSSDKVKQEVLRGLGDLYVQAQFLFNDDMYLRLMAVMHLMIKSTMNPSDYDSELGSIPAVQRGILEIIPMLRPTNILSSMWTPLLLELLCYLKGHGNPLEKNSKQLQGRSSDAMVNGAKRAFVERSHLNDSGTKLDSMLDCGWGILFVEKLVPIIVNLFLEAPPNERFSASPEVIQGLGRCMNTRRDNPKGTLWRISAECFNRVMTDEVKQDNANCKSDANSYGLSRARFWKEVADVYETFLVGSCGRVLSSDIPSADSITADETLEMSVLTVFGEDVLKLQKDAPVEVSYPMRSNSFLTFCGCTLDARISQSDKSVQMGLLIGCCLEL